METSKHLSSKKHSILLCVTVFIMYSVVYMSKNCFAAAMAAIVNDGILTKTQTGTIIASFWLFYAIFQVPGGIISNRYKPELLVFIGIIGSAIINLALFIFHNYYAMLIIWSINAIIQLGVWPSTFRILSKELHKSHSYHATYYIPMTFILGLGISYALAAIVKRWEYNFLISAILLTVVAVAFICVYKGLECKGAFETSERTVIKKQKSDKGVLISQLITSGVVILVPAIVLQFFVSNGIKVYAPVMLLELFPGISVSVSNILGGIISISTALGILFLNLFYPKRIKSSTVTIAVMFSITLAMNVVLIYAQHVSWIVFFVSIIMALIPLSAITQFVNIIIPGHFKASNCDVALAGILNSVASVGILISSFGVGYLSDNYSWTTIFAVFSALTLIAVVLTCLANKRWNKFANE